jgi:glycosyltransferase 2 family protein
VTNHSSVEPVSDDRTRVRARYRQFLIGLAKYGLGLGLLAWMLWRYWTPAPDGSSPGLSGIFQRPIQFGPLVAASVITLGSILLTFYRWYILVIAQQLTCSLFNAMRLGMVGYYLSNFLPGSVAGDLFKAVFLAKDQSRRTVAVATVMMDRVVGLLGLFWLIGIVGAILMAAGDPHGILDNTTLHKIVLVGFGCIVGSTVAGAVWLWLPARAEKVADILDRHGKIGHSFAELWRAMWMYRRQWRWVVATIALSVIGHVGFASAFYFAAQTFADPGSMDQIPTFVQHLLIVPVGLTVAALFPAPGGLGGAEAAFGQLYFLVLGTDAARDNGIAGQLTYRMINCALGLVGYIIYLRTKSQMLHAAEVVEPVSDEQSAMESVTEAPALLR